MKKEKSINLNPADYQEIMKTMAASLGLNITDDMLAQFLLYEKTLLTWNAKINLVSLDHPGDLWIKHFLDSLSCLTFLPREALRIIDLGSGAGFPGLPIKIVRPDVQLHLVEGIRKKASFLTHCTRVLGMTEACVHQEQASVLGRQGNFASAFDVIVSRAAFKLPELVLLANLFLVKGGLLVALKGSNIFAAELAEGARAGLTAGLSLQGCHRSTLPSPAATRYIVIFKKSL